jgi:extracellular factor (EF) 3-hydroxypalmitic acid methyl ester biosynthesis protein
VTSSSGAALVASQRAESTLAGHLYRAERRYAVRIACGTRTSLAVAFDAAPPHDRTVFDRLAVRVGERELELSTCRYHAGGAEPFAGRLLFLSQVYDVRALVEDGELCTPARDAFAALPLLIGSKDAVRPEFRIFAADAMHDFSVWRTFLDDQERVLAGEPPDVAEAAREALLAAHGPDFFAFFDAHAAQLAALVKEFTREEHERHASYFRRNAWPYISASEMLRRTNQKPSGYAGDAEMMRLLYEDRYVGASVFERLMHAYPVRVPAARAVRNRLRIIPEMLRAVQASFAAAGVRELRFLSAAAGPACELDDIFRSAEDAERLEGTLLDQDGHALAVARENVARIERARGCALRMEYLQESVRTMLRPHAAQRIGRYHFIYSMGLFDYLGTSVARAVLGRLYELLAPGGTAVIGNYHVANPSRFYMDYWADWPLLYRTEAGFAGLAADLPGAAAEITFDPSGCQMFLSVRRPG